MGEVDGAEVPDGLAIRIALGMGLLGAAAGMPLACLVTAWTHAAKDVSFEAATLLSRVVAGHPVALCIAVAAILLRAMAHARSTRRPWREDGWQLGAVALGGCGHVIWLGLFVLLLGMTALVALGPALLAVRLVEKLRPHSDLRRRFRHWLGTFHHSLAPLRFLAPPPLGARRFGTDRPPLRLVHMVAWLVPVLGVFAMFTISGISTSSMRMSTGTPMPTWISCVAGTFWLGDYLSVAFLLPWVPAGRR